VDIKAQSGESISLKEDQSKKKKIIINDKIKEK
jgi:hypothetical protein